ncbi:hypothetical protein CC80DRAFT_554485 [Byssothecium circinans]|uniref:Uncharacterized protein n=1 Tax=Byssothecium circinans TaxID=147558 RepID=A0A6A5TET8_9PLEO|nr:hypothetical protein CC80DRAFT_554485 [Byssothecium circinans]
MSQVACAFSETMLFTTSILALLLAAAGLISAAPVAASAAVELTSPAVIESEIFARQGMVCRPRRAKDAADQKKIDDALARMRQATALAHQGEESCPGVSRFNSASKQRKAEIKKTCVDGFQQCITQRKKANKGCVKAGGTIDRGHQIAVEECERQKRTWSAMVVPK